MGGQGSTTLRAEGLTLIPTPGHTVEHVLGCLLTHLGGTVHMQHDLGGPQLTQFPAGGTVPPPPPGNGEGGPSRLSGSLHACDCLAGSQGGAGARALWSWQERPSAGTSVGQQAAVTSLSPATYYVLAVLGEGRLDEHGT